MMSKYNDLISTLVFFIFVAFVFAFFCCFLARERWATGQRAAGVGAGFPTFLESAVGSKVSGGKEGLRKAVPPGIALYL